MGMGVCMCVSSSTKSPVDSYLCVCVLSKHSWKGCKCTHHMCVCLCTRKIKGGHECVYVCVRHHHSPINSYLCAYMYANTAERLRLYEAVILLLIMKYFVIKMISYSHTTAPCNLLSSPRLILRVHEHTHIWCVHLQPFQ